MSDTSAVTSTTPNAIVTASVGHPIIWTTGHKKVERCSNTTCAEYNLETVDGYKSGSISTNINIDVPFFRFIELDAYLGLRAGIGTFAHPRELSGVESRLGISLLVNNEIKDRESRKFIDNMTLSMSLSGAYLNLDEDTHMFGASFDASVGYYFSENIAAGVGFSIYGARNSETNTDPTEEILMINPYLQLKIAL